MSAILAKAIRCVQNEAQGLLNLSVVRFEDLPDLMAGVLAGDPEAIRISTSIGGMLEKIELAPRAKPMLCSACPRPLRRGRYSVVAAIPAREDPSRGIVFAICRHCAIDRDAVEKKAVVALRRIWPDGRLVAITNPTGSRA